MKQRRHSDDGWLEEDSDKRIKVLFQRELPVSPGVLWQALTDGKALSVWFPEISLQPHKSGEFRIWFNRDHSGTPDVVGVVSEFDPPNCLVLGSMRFLIHPVADGCELTFSDILYFVGERSNEEIAEAVLGGWHAYMDRLIGFVSLGTLIESSEPQYKDQIVKGRELLAGAPRQD